VPRLRIPVYERKVVFLESVSAHLEASSFDTIDLRSLLHLGYRVAV
jgi:hypothetical protein